MVEVFTSEAFRGTPAERAKRNFSPQTHTPWWWNFREPNLRVERPTKTLKCKSKIGGLAKLLVETEWKFNYASTTIISSHFLNSSVYSGDTDYHLYDMETYYFLNACKGLGVSEYFSFRYTTDVVTPAMSNEDKQKRFCTKLVQENKLLSTLQGLLPENGELKPQLVGELNTFTEEILKSLPKEVIPSLLKTKSIRQTVITIIASRRRSFQERTRSYVLSAGSSWGSFVGSILYLSSTTSSFKILLMGYSSLNQRTQKVLMLLVCWDPIIRPWSMKMYKATLAQRPTTSPWPTLQTISLGCGRNRSPIENPKMCRKLHLTYMLLI